MRTLLILLLAAVPAARTLAAATPSANLAPGTNNLLIVNDGGTDFSATNIIFRKNVRAFESDMYLECELLTLTLQAADARPAQATGLTNLNTRLDLIVAETNLLMMARDTTILGDRAVYTKSNEVIVVTGDLVIIKTEKVLFYATNFVFNRLTSSGYAVGWTATEVELGDAFKGTNSLPSLGTGRKNAPATNPTPVIPRFK